jgi:hypothetical protein
VLRRNALTLALLVAICSLLLWFFGSPAPTRTSVNPPPTPLAPPAAPTPLPVERSALADTLNSPQSTIAADLRIVLDLITAFRTNFPREGNPVGSNAEITATLSGRNSLRFAFIAPDHPAINRAGELCDRYGTPFFFHAESGMRMTIQSAGPDLRLHTADDVVLAP